MLQFFFSAYFCYIEQRLDIFDQISEANNWTEANRIYYMVSRLRGVANDWYDGLESYNKNWVEWKTILLGNFPDIQNHAKQLRQMDTRTKKIQRVL